MQANNIIPALRRYQPDGLSPEQWDKARETAIEAVLATGVTSLRQAQNSLSRFGVFLSWHPMWVRSSEPDMKTLLTSAYIDSFVSVKNANRVTRTYLRGVARAVGALPVAAPIATQRTRPVAVRFWTKVVDLGPFTALAAGYRRLGNSLTMCTFGGISERLTGPQWDRGRLVAQDSQDCTSVLLPEATATLCAAAVELRDASDPASMSGSPAVTKKTVTAKVAKPLSRTAMLRAAKAAQNVRDAAAIQRATGKSPEPTLAALPLLPEEIAKAIVDFCPYRFGETNWERVAEATRHIVAGYDPPSLAWVRTQMGVLARFCLWVSQRPVRANSADPLRVVELLEVGLIDEYLTGPLATSPDGTRATVRSTLRRGVRRLAPDLASPAIAYQSVQAPYSAYECASLVRLARNQPTLTTRRGVSAIVALGLGAGLSAQEQRSITPESVVEVELDGIAFLFITVTGPRARTVVVRAGYEELLREALAIHRRQGRREDQLLYGRDVERLNVTTPVTSRARTALGTGIDLDPARLRSTWLVACMSSPVPLGALLRASGLRSARSLVDLVAYCPEPDERSVTAALRAVADRVAGEVVA